MNRIFGFEPRTALALLRHCGNATEIFRMKESDIDLSVGVVLNKKLGERFGGTKARLLSMPEMARGSEAEDMEFSFQVFDYDVEAI